MKMSDIQEFEREKRRNCESLRRDERILGLSRQLLHELDNYKYSYLWSSGGLPIIQTPADIVAQQEIIWETKPTIIVETGVARGGSLINSAMSLELNGGRGLVLGVDIDIRSHNRKKIEGHKFFNRIKLIEGSSTDEVVYEQVKQFIQPNDRVMVVLDSNHTYDHVLAELNLWGGLVTQGCYLVVADTMLYYATKEVSGSTSWKSGDDPLSALREYLKKTDKYVSDDAVNGKLIFSSSFNGYIKAQI
jgi:cephalosporin hydroxylase